MTDRDSKRLLSAFGLESTANHPDAVLLAAIDRYIGMRDEMAAKVRARGNAEPARSGTTWRALDALEAEIGRIPAATSLGARAKLGLALDLFPRDGRVYAIPASALRDYLAAMDAEAAEGKRAADR
ncbi:hypothetical protein EAH89_09900 [Roseomonas nepalensis]|uniref:Uncharacterized protein n=1 Tax=Muricoccus nepalensis TaxID=1854500 RepID=A0A502GAK8_9PROT|nr:hypothetical protein [Roseomonas nepalensis]TPG57733.1 hypothetical protein EAH89_09900 [Roseomonas nepalensis]